MRKTVLKYLLCLCGVIQVVYTNSECFKKVKYSVKTVTKDYDFETEKFEKEVISPNKDVFSITLEENIPVLCKGILNLTKVTHHFYGWGRGIEDIEAGVFENQNLDSQLYLSNNSLTIIKRKTFKNILITELDLTYNDIKIIEEGAMQDMPNLATLHLSRNKIKEFYPNSIENTPKLLFFDMSYNKMKKLDDEQFSFMSKERNVGIGVAFNELTEIQAKAFADIDVFSLYLNNNKLKSIPAEVFSGNKLHYLNIAYNNLKRLDDEFFKQNTSTLINVELEENNFDDETAEKLKTFMKIILQHKLIDKPIKRF